MNFLRLGLKRIVFLGHVLVLGEVVESNLHRGVHPESMLIEH